MNSTPLARRFDASTSILAARNAARRLVPTHEQKILDAIRQHPGICAPEIARLCGWGEDNTPVSRRMKAMVNAGKVIEGPPKRFIHCGHEGYFTTYRLPLRLGEQGRLPI